MATDRYEYKILIEESKLGFDFKKKCRKMEVKWNELGNEGWEFCTFINGGVIFKRKIAE